MPSDAAKSSVRRPCRHEREMGRDDPSAPSPNEIGERLQSRGQRCDFRRRLTRAPIGAEGMNEVVLQIADQQRGRRDRMALRRSCRTPFDDEIAEAVDRAARPGSTAVVASGCSSTAGPSTTAPTGRSSRDQMPREPAAREPDRRAPRRAASRSVPGRAQAARSNAGRRPIAAVRSDTTRTGMSGKRRLNCRL